HEGRRLAVARAHDVQQQLLLQRARYGHCVCHAIIRHDRRPIARAARQYCRKAKDCDGAESQDVHTKRSSTAKKANTPISIRPMETASSGVACGPFPNPANGVNGGPHMYLFSRWYCQAEIASET